MHNAYPAGEESDFSDDEWDIGTSYEKTPRVQVSWKPSILTKSGLTRLASLRLRGHVVDVRLIEQILFKPRFLWHGNGGKND